MLPIIMYRRAKNNGHGAMVILVMHGINNLTDEDGPYIELMTGVFTDNQPDFSWMQPNEEKTFTQYFMPYAEIGICKKCNQRSSNKY